MFYCFIIFIYDLKMNKDQRGEGYYQFGQWSDEFQIQTGIDSATAKIIIYLLVLLDKYVTILNRRKEIEKAAVDIYKLLQENCVLFGMQDQTNLKEWQNYMVFIDSIVADALLNAIGCR